MCYSPLRRSRNNDSETYSEGNDQRPPTPTTGHVDAHHILPLQSE